MESSRKKELIQAYKERKREGCVYEIICTGNGKRFLRADSDAQGAQNRFQFSQMTGSALSPFFQEDWKKYGAQAFTFRLVETLEKTDDQTEKEFREDLETLAQLVRERYLPKTLY